MGLTPLTNYSGMHDDGASACAVSERAAGTCDAECVRGSMLVGTRGTTYVILLRITHSIIIRPVMADLVYADRRRLLAELVYADRHVIDAFIMFVSLAVALVAFRPTGRVCVRPPVPIEAPCAPVPPSIRRGGCWWKIIRCHP